MKRFLSLITLTVTLAFTAKPVYLNTFSDAAGSRYTIAMTGGKMYQSCYCGADDGCFLQFQNGQILIAIYHTSDFRAELNNLRNMGLIIKETEQHSNPWVWNYIVLDPINIENMEVWSSNILASTKSFNRETILTKCHLPLNYGQPPVVEEPVNPPAEFKTSFVIEMTDNEIAFFEAEAKGYIQEDRFVFEFKHKDEYRDGVEALENAGAIIKDKDNPRCRVKISLENVQRISMDGAEEYVKPSVPDEPKDPVIDIPVDTIPEEPATEEHILETAKGFDPVVIKFASLTYIKELIDRKDRS